MATAKLVAFQLGLISALVLTDRGAVFAQGTSLSQTEIRCYIDGRSRLTLDGQTAIWRHDDFAAPGRLDCDIGAPIEPTYIDGVAWWPNWPDVPTCENRFCHCDSDSYAEVQPGMPDEPFVVGLEIIEARGTCQIVEYPTLSNGFRVVIEFTDWDSGAAWYHLIVDAGVLSPPSVYCTAKQNSLGCTPHIGFIGTPSLSAVDEFTVLTTDVRNFRSGLMVWSRASASQAFQGGFLCVEAPLHRTPLQDSGGNPGLEDCSGTFSFALSPYYLTGANVSVGEQLYAQFWSRDPYSVPYPVSLTDALGFTIYP